MGMSMGVAILAAILLMGDQQPPRRWLPSPRLDLQGHDALTVDFWCLYDDAGRPQCKVDRVREAVSLDVVAAVAWMNERAEPREDLAGLGIEKHYAIAFDAEYARPAPQDKGPFWRFAAPLLEAPEWRVGSADVDPRILTGVVPRRDWDQLRGEISMTCQVLDHGWLGFCLMDTPENRAADAASRADLRSLAWLVASNMRMAEVTADGVATKDHQVEFVVQFAPPPEGTRVPRMTPPHVVSAPEVSVLTALYPPEAQSASLAGDVSYQCISIAEEAPVETCALYNEAPLHAGFAGAALKVLKLRVVRPMLIDGEPVRSIVTQSVRWRP